MSLTREDVKYVADLARLEFSEEELMAFTIQLSDVLNYFQTLNQLDTSQIKATEHLLDLKNVFRKDVVRQCLSNEKALANAPDAEAGCFKVPRVME